MADAEPPFEQRLRAEGAEQRDVHGGGHDPPDTEAVGEGSVNLAKHALREPSDRSSAYARTPNRFNPHPYQTRSKSLRWRRSGLRVSVAGPCPRSAPPISPRTTASTIEGRPPPLACPTASLRTAWHSGLDFGCLRRLLSLF